MILQELRYKERDSFPGHNHPHVSVAPHAPTLVGTGHDALCVISQNHNYYFSNNHDSIDDSIIDSRFFG
jgi:hypothetical protein